MQRGFRGFSDLLRVPFEHPPARKRHPRHTHPSRARREPPCRIDLARGAEKLPRNKTLSRRRQWQRKDAISKMRGRHPDQRWKYRIVLEVLPESTYRLKNRSACTSVARIWLVNEIARFSGFALVRCYLDARIGRWKSHSIIAVCDRIAVRVESTFLVIRQQILSTIWQLNTMNILLLRDK